VLAVDYRLAPEHHFPKAFEDAEDALAWLLTYGRSLGLDTERLAYAGDSVGGTLSTALTLANKASGRVQPLLQLLLYPCTSATLDTPSHHRHASGFLLERRTLEWMFSQYLRSDDERHDWRFAPLEAPSLAGLASTHIALAEFDPLHDEGLAYAHRLRAAGVQVGVEVYSGMVHDFARLGAVVGTTATLRADLARTLSTAFR
jgi:acetyl esterase